MADEILSRAVFKSGIAKIETIWGKISIEKLDIYYDILKKIKSQKFLTICDKLIATRLYPTFPLPAEFLSISTAENLARQTTAQMYEDTQKLLKTYVR